MEIRSAGAQPFQEDGRTDGETGLKLIFAYRNFANAPKNGYIRKQLKIVNLAT
jgi:hypothetical protein